MKHDFAHHPVAQKIGAIADRLGDGEAAARSAVTVLVSGVSVSGRGLMTSAVGMPSEAAKAARCGPRARATYGWPPA